MRICETWIDPVAGHVLTLLHGPRAATRVPLTVSPAAPAEGLEWLDELRRFQGEAHRLPGTKRLDGREVHGWELELGGVATVLWAAPDGLPVAMEQRLPGGMELQHRFRFDDNDIPVTISVGVSLLPADVSDPHEFIRLADKKLYEAKNGGRNRVVAKAA